MLVAGCAYEAEFASTGEPNAPTTLGTAPPATASSDHAPPFANIDSSVLAGRVRWCDSQSWRAPFDAELERLGERAAKAVEAWRYVAPPQANACNSSFYRTYSLLIALQERGEPELLDAALALYERETHACGVTLRPSEDALPGCGEFPSAADAASARREFLTSASVLAVLIAEKRGDHVLARSLKARTITYLDSEDPNRNQPVLDVSDRSLWRRVEPKDSRYYAYDPEIDE